MAPSRLPDPGATVSFALKRITIGETQAGGIRAFVLAYFEVGGGKFQAIANQFFLAIVDTFALSDNLDGITGCLRRNDRADRGIFRF